MSKWRSVYRDVGPGPLVEHLEFQRSTFKNITAIQWTRLEGLLTVGAVVELGWLQSAAGLRRDSAHQLLVGLSHSGAGSVTRLVFHTCAEHPVAHDVWPTPGWLCPECECGVGDGTLRFETRVTLTKPVRFI